MVSYPAAVTFFAVGHKQRTSNMYAVISRYSHTVFAVGHKQQRAQVELLKEISYDLGIEFNFRCPVWPNTIMAHILVEYANTVNDGALQSQVVDRLFRAYFTKGRALEKRHIIAVAEDVGFDVYVVEKLIDDPDRAEEIKQRAAVWRTMGIEAIPFIFMNGHSMFSGDQDEAALINTITKVAQKFPLGHGDTCL